MGVYQLNVAVTLSFCYGSVVKLDDDEDPSIMIISSATLQTGEEQRPKKPNPKYNGSPWTPEGKGKRPRTSTSQILHRLCKNTYQPVLPLDPLEHPNDGDCENFLRWYNRHAIAFAP